MVLTASFVRFLDRPGGRRVLAKLATRAARRETYADVEILYRNLWAHRVGKYYYPDGRKFSSDLKWADLSQEYVRNAEERWLRYGRPQKGDVVIDVGAGRGEDTLAFSQAVGETGRVIAIEAHPVSFEFLKCFCTLNRLTNVTAVQVAAMDKPGIVSMTESENWEANSVVLSRRSQGTKVQGETLDQICDREAVEEISLIKMNIEGAERYALLGMQSVIRRTGTICVACHDFLADLGHGEEFRTRAFVEGFLIDHGFKLASRRDDPRDWVRDHIFGLRVEGSGE